MASSTRRLLNIPPRVSVGSLRRLGVSLTRRQLAYFTMVVTVFFPFVSFLFYDSDVLGTQDVTTFLEIQKSKCPQGWTIERCRTRQEEFWGSVKVNEHIRSEMENAARQRAQRDEYQRGRPHQWQEEQTNHFQNVQQALRGGTTNSSDQFSPWANFSHNSFADLSILGFPKAGTSQLFNLLVSHPHAAPVFKRKEYCIDHGHFLDYTLPQHLNNPNTLRSLKKNLFGYHSYMLRKRSESRDRSLQLINACLQPREIEYHLSYTPMPEKSKYLLLFRDPADWLWASWNFWIDKHLDDRPAVDHDWATFGIHYRSPELFHELILSRESIKSAAKRFRTMREQTVHTPRRLIHLMGRDRLLFLKSEDMKATNGRLPQFLEQLGTFTGLSVSGFNITVAQGQTNCNAQKGFRNVCAGATGSGYHITHNRPMLEETRKLIYIQFWEECKIWKIEFGIVYQDCVDSVVTS
jgi:hypothetical protein